jgi:anti-sigma factor RsiW
MTQFVPSGDKDLLLQAALDGELDAAGMLAFERALLEDAGLAAEYTRLQALRGALRKVKQVPASPALRAKVEALAGMDAPTRRPQPRVGGWRPTALAASLALVVGSGLTALLLPHPPPQSTQLLVSSHVRGVISGQATDVLSSDRHAVKPWFATRSTVSPRVVDLAGDGFPLVGGRLDVIGVTPLPTLVYRHGAHIISLTEVPDKVANPSSGHSTVEGLDVLSWREGDTSFVAISDAQPAELDAFAAAYRKAIAAAP